MWMVVCSPSTLDQGEGWRKGEKKGERRRKGKGGKERESGGREEEGEGERSREIVVKGGGEDANIYCDGTIL